MSNKGLIVPAVVTLSKKMRRSMTNLTTDSTKYSVKETSTLASIDNSEPSQQQQQLQLHSPPDSACYEGVEDTGLTRPPSYQTAVRGDDNKGPSTSSSGGGDDQSPASPEWEDVAGATAADDDSPGLEMTETRFIDLASSFFPAVPPGAELPPLPKPVLIPRVNPGAQIPFARAWCPELANHSIALPDFLTFIDNLNVVMTPHAAIRFFEIAGAIVGIVPYDAAEAVGGVVEGLAIAAHIAVSYKLMKGCIDKMNENFFHPRKLHLKIANTKRVMKMLGLDKKDPLIAPLSEETLELSLRDRCLRHLSDKICDLEFDGLPQPSKQTDMLARIAAWKVKHKLAKAERAAKMSRKRNWKRHQKGKKLRQGWGERQRVKGLDWLVIQNFDEWEARKAEKAAAKEEKKSKSKNRRLMTW